MPRNKKNISISKKYKYLFTDVFGDTPRVKVIELLFYMLMNSENEPPKTYISQISRFTKLSKSSVKYAIDDLIKNKILIEVKEKTHAKYPKRFVYIDRNNQITNELYLLYKKIYNSFLI